VTKSFTPVERERKRGRRLVQSLFRPPKRFKALKYSSDEEEKKEEEKEQEEEEKEEEEKEEEGDDGQ
jgi:hypothetical protein